MPRSMLRIFGASTLLSAVTAGTLLAQPDATHRTTSPRWEPFLGCWSTSSAGVGGPMVCVVPTDSAQRVEFLTVDGDSVLARTIVDASGRYLPQRRGACQGLERGRWSSDSLRIYIESDYQCARGEALRADAILDLTHLDAFTFIEGSSGVTNRIRTVNFIVQLDTLVFPREVKRRLPGYRSLSMNVAELETPLGSHASILRDFGAEIPFQVLDAWMQNRGESAVFALTDREAHRVATRKRDALSRSLRAQSAPAVAWMANGGTGDRLSRDGWTTFGSELWGVEAAGYTLTPASVGFGQPIGPFANYIPAPAGSVSFRWP